jgi:hypothetical protein
MVVAQCLQCPADFFVSAVEQYSATPVADLTVLAAQPQMLEDILPDGGGNLAGNNNVGLCLCHSAGQRSQYQQPTHQWDQSSQPRGARPLVRCRADRLAECAGQWQESGCQCLCMKRAIKQAKVMIHGLYCRCAGYRDRNAGLSGPSACTLIGDGPHRAKSDTGCPTLTQCHRIITGDSDADRGAERGQKP